MADALRGSMDPAEYKHVVLGLIFLKYISDAFEERRSAIETATAAEGDEDRQRTLEDRDQYAAYNVFWVPEIARWPWLQQNAKQPNVGKLIDDAMESIEQDNPR